MFRKFLLFILLCRMLCGCSLFSPTKELSLSIDDIPDSLASSLSGCWTVVQSSNSCEPSVTEMDWTAGIPEHFHLDSPREEDLFLLLYPPLLMEGCRMNPLGVFIPSYDDSGSFSSKDGSAVSILTTLIENKLNLEGFNYSRFLLEMARLDDPWLVEEQTLLKQLGRRQMRTWYIREKTLFSIKIALPPGLWFGPSLLQDAVESSGFESPLQLELPEGYSFLYNPERRELIQIQVDSHGEALWISSAAD